MPPAATSARRASASTSCIVPAIRLAKTYMAPERTWIIWKPTTSAR
jgi:hypothetical protein